MPTGWQFENFFIQMYVRHKLNACFIFITFVIEHNTLSGQADIMIDISNTIVDLGP